MSLAKVDIVVPPVDLPNFTLTTNIFTKKVWMYTGNTCPLYKISLYWAEEPMCRVLKNKQCGFVSRYLRRTLWVIMIELDRFYC